MTPGTGAPADPVREALADAIRQAALAGRWDVVERLAGLGTEPTADASREPQAASEGDVIDLRERREEAGD